MYVCIQYSSIQYAFESGPRMTGKLFVRLFRSNYTFITVKIHSTDRVKIMFHDGHRDQLITHRAEVE